MSEKGKQCLCVWIATINMQHGSTRVANNVLQRNKTSKILGNVFQVLTNVGEFSLKLTILSYMITRVWVNWQNLFCCHNGCHWADNVGDKIRSLYMNDDYYVISSL